MDSALAAVDLHNQELVDLHNRVVAHSAVVGIEFHMWVEEHSALAVDLHIPVADFALVEVEVDNQEGLHSSLVELADIELRNRVTAHLEQTESVEIALDVEVQLVLGQSGDHLAPEVADKRFLTPNH